MLDLPQEEHVRRAFEQSLSHDEAVVSVQAGLTLFHPDIYHSDENPFLIQYFLKTQSYFFSLSEREN